MFLLYSLVFIISCFVLYFSGNWLIDGLKRIGRFLHWREFIIAFFVMAFAGSLPNLFVGISSAIHKVPQLSFGDIVGGNLIDLTLAVALAVLIGKNAIPTKGKILERSALFTTFVAILPLLLIWDGVLGRGDGLILLFVFVFYILWLVLNKERFREFSGDEEKQIPSILKEFRIFIKDLGLIILSFILLLLAAEGIVQSAKFFAVSLNISLPIIGILIVALGNTLPEIRFAVASAKAGKTEMILGNLMGAVIIPATLVLGTVALICPIIVPNFTPFAIARIFLIISAIAFYIFTRRRRKITKKEAIILLLLYVSFVIIEILIK
ncbi:MAG: sodium:calcium antiporter [Candidatus Pacebacteria bacterium]|nr:sodium:calcium antiporter [Candidatus Paceibacterota bacterium]